MIKSIELHLDHIMDPTYMKKFVNSGFRFADVTVCEPKILAMPDWEDQYKRIRETMESYGVKAAQTHLYYYNILRSCESTDEETDGLIRRSVAATGIVGAKWGAFHPRSGHSFGYERKREAEENTKAINKLLDTADKYDVGIAVENIPVFPDCPQYNFFTSIPEEHIEFVDSFRCERVAACWDTGHANLMPMDQAESIRLLGNRIKILHMHDNLAQADNHSPPTTGFIRWNLIMNALRDIHFEGPLSLEVRTPAPRVAATYLAHCYDCACMLEELYQGTLTEECKGS